MPPPAPSHRFNIGIAAPAASAGASPPRSAAVRLQSPGTFFRVSNVPGHLNSDELKQRMSAHPGCLTHTLRCRPSDKVVGTVEFQVEFSDHALAEQCQSSLMGRPFLESHPECGGVVLQVKTLNQSDIDSYLAKTASRGPVTFTPAQQPGQSSASTGSNRPNPAGARPAPVRPPAPPAITIATFDIGPRPSADVRSHVFVCVWHCVVDLIVSLAADACESAAAD